MGQKVNPVAFRTGINEDWKSRWYANKREFANLLVEDKQIRDFIKTRKITGGDVRRRDQKDQIGRPYYPAIAKIEIERTRDEVRVILFSARPGQLIGRDGERVAELQNALQKITGRRINLKIEEVTRPEIVAQLIAEDIGDQLVKRASFRRTMKRAIETTMEAGAKGIKIQLSGRLGGAEMARCEKQIAGSIPLSTLRTKIDYGFVEAKIAQGHIGIQVWVNQGEYSDESTDITAAPKPARTGKRVYRK
ncbi:MAG: 30S ribosomal protein S3 [Planctomycetaceae bacterium]|jgi:small subunit ribosomal protein S3|nr:30S ribosomal protein S3 [Planctomycetaceae bacterium]